MESLAQSSTFVRSADDRAIIPAMITLIGR
jgi:hypothetical protein